MGRVMRASCSSHCLARIQNGRALGHFPPRRTLGAAGLLATLVRHLSSPFLKSGT